MRYPAPLLSALLILSLVSTACKKDDDDAPENPGTGSTSQPDRDAMLVTTRTETNGTITYHGSAIFMDDADALVDAGAVTLNGVPVDTLAAGIYTVSSSTSSLDLSTETVVWTVAGGSGYPAFNQQVDDISFPIAGVVNSNGTVDKSNGYTFSCSSMAGADSVFFMLSYDVWKSVPGSSASCTFTPAELAPLSPGPILAFIQATTYTNRAFGGKQCQFMKMHTATKDLTVVE